MKTHQTKIKTSKPIGKRTFTLKELAQRNFAVNASESSDNTKPIFNLVNIQEDLLEEEGNGHTDYERSAFKSQDISSAPTESDSKSLNLPIELVNHLIAKEISKLAKILDLEEAELQAWIDVQVMAPKQTLLALLRISREHLLDPLKEEVALALYDDLNWQAYITVEGYSKILNKHPAFDGLTFTQSEEMANGIPIWMECTIYRKDRSNPIVVREYFEEVKGEQVIWQKMPRRMLRHRVMQQCARLM